MIKYQSIRGTLLGIFACKVPLFHFKRIYDAEMQRRKRFIERYKITRRNEYFTRYDDIAKELDKYDGAFEGKTIYLNCDEVRYSQFWWYFYDNFKKFGIKKLIATHYSPFVVGRPSQVF